ncbi:signal transduction histidine kinase [Fontibacillus phaseoli]|uniref:Heme sensor protein HssS n=1 Tax=Fontibacillus phaseoli TaxID=1416533 RepID=A0A369B503_9BACL|nr:HAMP domain-containing sensor histidine kinase [Fontibacillus phaseoli]RCX15606.1 signal transduction histidine kinase [Fontibacillus phaseoli]
MIKSLYIRIVLMFLSAIIVSLLTSAIITGYVYEKSVNKQTETYLIRLGESLVRIFERTGFDKRSLVMDDIKELVHSISFEIYNEKFNRETYGYQAGAESFVSKALVERVLRGETVRGEIEDNFMYVGFHFEHQGEVYAMFIQPGSSDQIGYPVNNMLLTMIGIVLIGGSLFFTVEATFLILPLRKMTEATKRMARGDFSTDLKVRRKDELGVLVKNFDEMRQQLQQMEQMRQDFVSNVSHEIQSPLTSIRGFAKALKDETLEPKDRERSLDIIIAESERMSRMGDNLLKLASLESEHHPFQPEAFRLDEQIRQIVIGFEPQWSAKSIDIDLHLPAVVIKGDSDGLNQVWINLLGNSLKFTPEGGNISILLRQEVHKVVVTFKDSGIGIPAEDQPHIFERFYKADPSRNRSQNGNGLGLAIVKKMIDLHRGRIHVHSQPGQGTTIVVTLPYYSLNSSKEI